MQAGITTPLLATNLVEKSIQIPLGGIACRLTGHSSMLAKYVAESLAVAFNDTLRLIIIRSGKMERRECYGSEEKMERRECYGSEEKIINHR